MTPDTLPLAAPSFLVLLVCLLLNVTTLAVVCFVAGRAVKPVVAIDVYTPCTGGGGAAEPDEDDEADAWKNGHRQDD